MRFWQQFRTLRGAAAALSALLALALGIVEMRSLVSSALQPNAETALSRQALISSAAIVAASLGGALLSLRRGNMLYMIVAWAFLFGLLFKDVLRFFDEIGATGQTNLLIAVLYANAQVLTVIVGFMLALSLTFLRRRKPTPE